MKGSALGYAIENKVRLIETYKAHRDKDDLSEWSKEEYSDMILKLEKDIEDIKEEYRATEKLKYSKDDVRLSPKRVSIRKDMSDERETYRDDVGGEPESSVLAEDRADEPVVLGDRDHDAYAVRKDYKELFSYDDGIYEDTRLSDWDDMAEAMNDMGGT